MIEILLYAAVLIAVGHFFYRRGYLDGGDDAIDDLEAEINGKVYDLRGLADELTRIADSREAEE